MGEPMLVVWSLATYAGIGLVVGAAFVLVAAPRALGHAAAITPGGRALLFPGAQQDNLRTQGEQLLHRQLGSADRAVHPLVGQQNRAKHLACLG